jgi:hypothetical protein
MCKVRRVWRQLRQQPALGVEHHVEAVLLLGRPALPAPRHPEPAGGRRVGHAGYLTREHNLTCIMIGEHVADWIREEA